jgi:hypothetical protein
MPATSWRRTSMLDAIFIVGELAFFAISIGYTIICDRL